MDAVRNGLNAPRRGTVGGGSELFNPPLPALPHLKRTDPPRQIDEVGCHDTAGRNGSDRPRLLDEQLLPALYQRVAWIPCARNAIRSAGIISTAVPSTIPGGTASATITLPPIQ
jgi:hypothetical protein